MFHCLVIKVVCLSSLCDSLFTLSYLSNLVKHFFQKFFRFSRSCLKLFVSVVLFKRLDYFIISSVDLSTVNLNFLKTILFFSISEAIPCDSLFTIPLSQGIVKHFLQKSLYFFVQIICRIMSNSFFLHFSPPCSYTITKHFISVSLFNIISGIFRRSAASEISCFSHIAAGRFLTKM